MVTDEQNERRKLTVELHCILSLLDDEKIPMSFIEDRLIRLLRKGERVNIISTHDLRIDLIKLKVHRAGKLIRLTQKEFDVLQYLMRRAGTSVSKGELLREVWKYNCDVITHTVATHINRLRQKIDKGHSVKLLINSPNSGYMILGNSPSL